MFGEVAPCARCGFEFFTPLYRLRLEESGGVPMRVVPDIDEKLSRPAAMQCARCHTVFTASPSTGVVMDFTATLPTR